MNQPEEEELDEQRDESLEEDESKSGNSISAYINGDLIDAGADVIGSGAVEVLEKTVEKAVDVVGEVISGLWDL